MLTDFEAEIARRHLIDFITTTKENYSVIWFHNYVCSQIESLVNGDCNRMMIFIPPQHGKSEISSRRLPAWLIGNKPDNNIALITYNQTFASKFNREIQRIMSELEYAQIFPNIRLPRVNESYSLNSTDIEIPDHGGSIKTIGVGGALTGNKVDFLIIDDVYKDAQDAWSPVGRESVKDWYSTVAETRLHNDSKVLIVFTRWHEEDLAGHLLSVEPNKWEVIKLPAIKDDNSIDYDTRQIGEALWPELHSLESMEAIRQRDKVTFACLYQQDPQPSEGLLYNPFKTHDRDAWGYVQCKIDVADSGKDKLCAICYEHVGELAYVKDLVYTDEGHRESKSMLIDLFKRNNVQQAEFESNSAGNIYADNIRDMCQQEGLHLSINKKYQSKNKEARILGAASMVNDNIYMPDEWHRLYPEFYRDVTRFRRLFVANKHDDAPDTLTSIAESLRNNIKINFI